MIGNQNGFMNHIRSELSFSVPNEQCAESNRRPRRGRRESGSAGRYPSAPSPPRTAQIGRRDARIILFFHFFFAEKKLYSTFAVSKRRRPRDARILGYGVMVTLQILVLSFQVRILVAQPKRLSETLGQPFFISTPDGPSTPSRMRRIRLLK